MEIHRPDLEEVAAEQGRVARRNLVDQRPAGGVAVIRVCVVQQVSVVDSHAACRAYQIV